MLSATQDRAANRQFQADYSNKGFARLIQTLFESLSDQTVLHKLLLLEPADNAALRDEQQETARRYMNLVIRMATQRAWSLSLHSECAPDNWAGLLDSDLVMAKRCFQRMREDAEIITRAWESLSGASPNADKEARTATYFSFDCFACLSGVGVRLALVCSDERMVFRFARTLLQLHCCRMFCRWLFTLTLR